tara:strand:- start:765 stop:971 length:207 start_codon:yes stop_codon:yes gene_type:complete
MFLKSKKLLKNLDILSDGSLIRNSINFNYSKLKINFLEKDFKLKLKNSINKKTQSSSILNNYRKNIFK